MIRFTCATLGALCLMLSSSLAAQEREIVFLAGPKDHGFPGRHEYEKDLRLLAGALDSAPNLRGIRTKVLVGLAPKFDLAQIANASVLVLESGGDWQERERHPFFPPDLTTNGRGYDAETTAWLVQLDSLIARNRIGIVILHYTNWVENWEGRRRYYDWSGGYWVQMVSKNPSDQWSITLATADHPVLRGVRPWQYRDEIFSRFFLPENPRRTPLLIGTPTRTQQEPTTVGWAYERPNGGRGLVFGGVDFHDNMMNDDYRTFLLNAVVWTAGLDVPAGGVQSTRPVIEPVPDRPPPRRP